MQISGANLLASQQATRAQTGPASPAGANFMAALAKTKKSDELFAPLDFKPAEQPAAPQPAAAPQGYSPGQPMGSKLDIRV